MKIILVFAIIFSLDSKANFEKLSAEFLIKNSSIKNLIGNSIKADESIKFVESTLAPKLDGGVSYLDNDSDAANAVNFAAGKTTAVEMNLSKATSWGGIFSFKNSFEKVIQDPSRIRIFGGDPEIHQFRQSLSFSTSLTRNLFGHEFDLRHNSSIMNAEYIDSVSQHSVNDLVIQFSKAYSGVVLNKELYNLQVEALERANKRLALVKRRVGDGINLKADLYRAESAKIFQEQQLDQSKQDYNQALFVLSSMIHRNITKSEIDSVEGISNQNLNVPGDVQKVKLNINARRSFADQQELERDLKMRQMLPEVNFSVAYQTNDYDANSSEVFSRGNLAGDKKTLSVGFNFIYNFGQVSEKAGLTQAEINHNQALHQLRAEIQNDEERRKMLASNIELSELNISKAKKRVSLSTAIIKEYVKLFSLGRVTLDQVIQAEEDLINSQRSFAQQTILNFNQKLELASLDYFLAELIEREIK